MDNEVLEKSVFTFNSSYAQNPCKFKSSMMMDGNQNIIRDLDCGSGLDTKNIPSLNFFIIRK